MNADDMDAVLDDLERAFEKAQASMMAAKEARDHLRKDAAAWLDSLKARATACEAMPSLAGWQSLADDAIELADSQAAEVARLERELERCQDGPWA